MQRTPLQQMPHRPDPYRPASRVMTPVSLETSWREMPWSLRILRAFLGVTFVYAGLQKFLDPGFLHAGSPTYIGTQLAGFARSTPAAPLMRVLEHVPWLVGVGVAVTEIAVGIAVLAGIGLIMASVIGLSINVVLWLSATWHVHPYFLGSDSIYAIAWLALIVGSWQVAKARPTTHLSRRFQDPDAIARRAMLRGGLVAGLAIAFGGVASALAGPPSASSSGITVAGGSDRPTHNSARATEPPQASSSPSPSATPSIPGHTIANLDSLRVGQALGFTAPGVGPAAVVRLANDTVVAYSRICTHAGCIVGYDSGSQLFVCPCHGAEFDPAQHADPTPGSPTSTPLQLIRVVVDKATGDVILPS
jgi:thiosulfate dehydrogenase (quinone) large subunit